jgi:hypothetical protein
MPEFIDTNVVIRYLTGAPPDRFLNDGIDRQEP